MCLWGQDRPGSRSLSPWLNPARVDLVERFEKLVADYNAGSMNVEEFFQQLLAFSNDLTEEEARSISEGLDSYWNDGHSVYDMAA